MQMPNFDNLIDCLAEIMQSRQPGQVVYSKIDLRYAYAQLKLALLPEWYPRLDTGL